MTAGLYRWKIAACGCYYQRGTHLSTQQSINLRDCHPIHDWLKRKNSFGYYPFICHFTILCSLHTLCVVPLRNAFNIMYQTLFNTYTQQSSFAQDFKMNLHIILYDFSHCVLLQTSCSTYIQLDTVVFINCIRPSGIILVMDGLGIMTLYWI